MSKLSWCYFNLSVFSFTVKYIHHLCIVIVNAGHFLYVTAPDGELTVDWAAFQSPLLEPTNSSHPCKVSPNLISSSNQPPVLLDLFNVTVTYLQSDRELNKSTRTSSAQRK